MAQWQQQSLRRKSLAAGWENLALDLKDFKQVFLTWWCGIAIGSFIYGFIPTDLIAEYAGEAQVVRDSKS